MTRPRNQGFTLIETVIYIALFSILIGSVFVTTLQLIDSSGDLDKKNVTVEEGNFVMRKINWALTGAKNVSVSSDTLVITQYDSSQIRFCLDSGQIKIKHGGSALCSSASFTPLTTENVEVSSLNFTTTTPAGMTVLATIDGQDFSITKFIR